jgi:hypothetical protein
VAISAAIVFGADARAICRTIPSSGDQVAFYTDPGMHRSLVERRLIEVNSRLKRVREELIVVDEQLTALAEAADEARIRYLVSETPLADRELREARRHADAMARSRAAVVDSITELERAQDELLDRLVTEPQ